MDVELVGDITARTVNDLIRHTRRADTIVLRLDSLGGDAPAGLRLYQHLQAVRRRGVHVTTVSVRAGSIAAVIAQAAGRRLIEPTGLLGVHAPHGPVGAHGLLHCEAQIVAALCARSRWTPDLLRAAWPFVCHGAGCVNVGLADEIMLGVDTVVYPGR